MKSGYILLLFCGCITRVLAAAPDTLAKPSSATQVVQIIISTSPLSTTGSSTTATSLPSLSVNDDLGLGQWLLVYMPMIVFFGLFFYFMSWLKKDGYQLSNALSECDPVDLKNVQTTAKTDPQQPTLAPTVTTTTTTEEVLPRSSSRLIAFLTGVSAVGIAVVIVSIQIYTALSGRKGYFDVDGLWKIIASLGIGIIPYGANMIKEAVQNPKNS